MKTSDHPILRHDPLLHRVWEQMGSPTGCRVVGGYVRDRILGRPSNDLDLTIEGEADEAATPARALAASLGVRAHLLGTPPHRIWRIEAPALKIELWPLGALSQEEDLLRRDFSCNALGWELPGGPLTDLVDGVGDIADRRLRAISRTNLADDPVRLLRAPRFLAQLQGFEFDEPTRSWIRELAPSLAGAPRERVGQELLALLRAPSASRGLHNCLELGLFGHAAPAGAAVDTPWLRTNIDATDRLPGASDAAHLALLFRAWGVPTPGKLAAYAWPKEDREKAHRAARLLDDALRTVGTSAPDRRELAWRAGSAFPTLITLGTAVAPNRGGWRRWCRQWTRNPAALEDPAPLLSGAEIAQITGIEPGPKLGRVVTDLMRAQIRGEVRSRGGAMTWLARKRPM